MGLGFTSIRDPWPSEYMPSPWTTREDAAESKVGPVRTPRGILRFGGVICILGRKETSFKVPSPASHFEIDGCESRYLLDCMYCLPHWCLPARPNRYLSKQPAQGGHPSLSLAHTPSYVPISGADSKRRPKSLRDLEAAHHTHEPNRGGHAPICLCRHSPIRALPAKQARWDEGDRMNDRGQQTQTHLSSLALRQELITRHREQIGSPVPRSRHRLSPGWTDPIAIPSRFGPLAICFHPREEARPHSCSTSSRGRSGVAMHIAPTLGTS